MKRIANDLLYDTEVSNLVYVDEKKNHKLYRTPNGNFFIVYPTGELYPKSLESAKDYLGKRDVDAYIRVFGEVEEA